MATCTITKTTLYNSPGMPKIFVKFQWGNLIGGATHRWSKSASFLSISRYISQTVQDRDIITIEG